MQNSFDAVGFVNDLLDKRIAEFVQKYPERRGCPEVVMMEELKHEINIAYADYLDSLGENVRAALEDLGERYKNDKIVPPGEFKQAIDKYFMNPPETDNKDREVFDNILKNPVFGRCDS